MTAETAMVWDDEECAPVTVEALYAIESDIGSGEWVMKCRRDEHGAGSPLIFLDRETALQVIKDEAQQSGCYDDQRVVVWTVAVHEPPAAYCENCDKWGHLDAACPAFAFRWDGA